LEVIFEFADNSIQALRELEGTCDGFLTNMG
jgi:hypothetical protein